MNPSKLDRIFNEIRIENPDVLARPNPPWIIAVLRSPWSALIFLLPFLLMLSVHQWLGLSDALLVAAEPGEPPAHGYNLAMGVLMNAAPLAALHHLLTRSQRGLPWIVSKLLILMTIFVLGLISL